MDTEGLLSIEKNDDKYDKQLSLFSMTMSNKLLINVGGEINESIKRILGIAVFAGCQL